MELKTVLSKISRPQGSPAPVYLALNISQETVTGAVWQLQHNQPTIISHGSSEEWDSPDKLLIAADASLSTALENLDHEPDKVILGLPPTWITADKINPDRQNLLKDLTTKLSLKAIGFVVSTEAISFYLKAKEGTPPTAIFIELSSTDVLITLAKLGKIIATHKVGRSDDLAADVQEGLARFGTTDPLPSRFIIFDGHLDLETARQTLLSYPWPEKLSFLHFPKIEILEPDVTTRALVQAAGNELTQALPDSAPEPIPTPASVGFFAPDQPAPPPRPSSPPPPQAPSPPRPTSLPAPPASPPIPLMAKFRTLLDSLKRLIPTSRPPVALIVPVVAVITSAILFGFLSWALPKATVTLYVSPTVIDSTLSAIVTSATEDLDRDEIHGQLVEAEVEDNFHTETTGTAEVGDKAKGEVTLFNKTSSTKKFSAGTILVGPNSLEFVLDSDVTIASQSATDTGITFGKSNAPATAKAVGTASNIPQDSNMTVKGFDTSTYSAKAATAFTGGTSREVKSVSKDDQDKLLTAATDQLIAKALDQLKAPLASDQVLIDQGFTPETITKKFTHAVGEETDTVSLNLKLRLATFVVNKADLISRLSQADANIPSGFVPVAAATTITITSAEISPDAESADISVRVATKLIPNLDIPTIIDYLKGKLVSSTENYLKALPNFNKVDIDASPQLPGGLTAFPRRASNIRFEVKLAD